MHKVNGEIMSKEAFLANTPYAKEPYEGILVSADINNNQYKIGIQLSEDEVLLVDTVKDQQVQEYLRQWVPLVNEIQTRYGVNNDLENYTHY